MDLQRKAIAEMLGTLWLVLGGTGAAVLAAIFLSDFQTASSAPASASSACRSPSASPS